MEINRIVLAFVPALTLVLAAGCSSPTGVDPVPGVTGTAVAPTRSAGPAPTGSADAGRPGSPDAARSRPPGGTPGRSPGDGIRAGVTSSAAGPPAAGTGQLPGTSRAGIRPPVVAHGPRAGNQVALTFDADLTDAMAYNLRSGRVRSYANLAVIALLERQQVPATFFITGQWAEHYPGVLKRLAGNPRFELANHSYEHAAFTSDCYGLPRVPASQMTNDVAKTFTVLAPYGGRQTRYFRFPGLCHDAAATAALAPLGVTVVDGDVVSGDPFATAAAPIVRAVLSKVRPGSIVIMHVTEANAEYTDEALPPILDGLRSRGLEPVNLSTLLAGAERGGAAPR